MALPLSKALISVIGLYYSVGHWNDFFTALIYIRNNELQPLQIVLRDILLSNQVFAGGAGTGGDAGGYAQRYADQIKYGVIIVSTLPILLSTRLFRSISRRCHDRLGEGVMRAEIAGL